MTDPALWTDKRYIPLNAQQVLQRAFGPPLAGEALLDAFVILSQYDWEQLEQHASDAEVELACQAAKTFVASVEKLRSRVG